jgi:hypothetical protein
VKKLLSMGFAAAFGVLSMTAMVATAHAFDDWDDGEEDPFDFAHEMATGGYQELVEGFEDGEFNPPFDEVDSDDEDEDEDEDE